MDVARKFDESNYPLVHVAEVVKALLHQRNSFTELHLLTTFINNAINALNSGPKLRGV